MKDRRLNRFEQEFLEKLGTMERGARIAYHRGEFCAGPLKKLAGELHDQGRVLLVSKRHGPKDTEYMVVKR